jgi:hypothetical protein
VATPEARRGAERGEADETDARVALVSGSRVLGNGTAKTGPRVAEEAECEHYTENAQARATPTS